MKYILIIIILLLLHSCENDDYLYKDVPRLYLSGDATQGAVGDSVVFSFKVYENSLTEYDLLIYANVIGEAYNHDREFKLEVVNNETNVSSEDYKISDLIVPANSFTGTAAVTVKRNITSVDISEEYATLKLKLIENDFFHISSPKDSEFKLLWCDFLTRPSSWDIINYYIGPFSQARYKFIIDNAGYIDFYEFENDYNKILWLQGYLNEKLNEYNANPENEGRPEGWPYLNDDGETPLKFGAGLTY